MADFFTNLYGIRTYEHLSTTNRMDFSEIFHHIRITQARWNEQSILSTARAKTSKSILLKIIKKLKKVFVDMPLRSYYTRQYTICADYTLHHLLLMGYIAGSQN